MKLSGLYGMFQMEVWRNGWNVAWFGGRNSASVYRCFDVCFAFWTCHQALSAFQQRHGLSPTHDRGFEPSLHHSTPKKLSFQNLLVCVSAILSYFTCWAFLTPILCTDLILRPGESSTSTNSATNISKKPFTIPTPQPVKQTSISTKIIKETKTSPTYFHCFQALCSCSWVSLRPWWNLYML